MKNWTVENINIGEKGSKTIFFTNGISVHITAIPSYHRIAILAEQETPIGDFIKIVKAYRLVELMNSGKSVEFNLSDYYPRVVFEELY